MNTEIAGARHFGSSLAWLADTAEINADAARDQRVSDAYTDVAMLLDEAANRMWDAANEASGVCRRLPGVLELPLEMRV
jgi:hypothetical protein